MPDKHIGNYTITGSLQVDAAITKYGNTVPEVTSSALDPVGAPARTGIIHINTATKESFISVGTASVNDWTSIKGGVPDTVIFVDSQTKFDSEYIIGNAGAAIILAPGNYDLPDAWIPEISLIGIPGFREVNLTDTGSDFVISDLAASTKISGITLIGDFDILGGDVEFSEVTISGRLLINESTASIKVSNSVVENITVTAGELTLEDTTLTEDQNLVNGADAFLVLENVRFSQTSPADTFLEVTAGKVTATEIIFNDIDTQIAILADGATAKVDIESCKILETPAGASAIVSQNSAVLNLGNVLINGVPGTALISTSVKSYPAYYDPTGTGLDPDTRTLQEAIAELDTLRLQKFTLEFDSGTPDWTNATPSVLTITHNLGTQDVLVQVYTGAAAPYSQGHANITAIKIVNSNTVTVEVAALASSFQGKVTVVG